MIRKIIAVLCTLFFGLILPISFFGGGLSASAAVLGLWPLDSSYRQITTYFDPERNNGNIYAGHNGIDIPANLNANIYAAADGVCVSSGWMDDYGNLVILWHEKLGVYTFYAHCSYYTVYAGQTVSAGEIIAHVGNTGVSQGNHLHFGICDNLVGGWPDIWYYDPLTFFTYKMEQDSGSCNCTEDYAGTYVTAGVDTYLNIRSGHGTGYSIVGQLYPYSEFVVTKADGTWAHIEYNDISGYCSMEYITPKNNAESGMNISGAVVPDGEISLGKPFGVGGIITSNLPITRVTGGIYAADGASPVYVCEFAPNTMKFDLSGEFDSKILFNELNVGTYVYKVEAEDKSGKIYHLIGKSFMVTASEEKHIKGDINGDGSINVSDAVQLQKFILGIQPLTSEQMKCADVSGDSYVNVFDMVVLRKMIIK